MRAPVDSWLPDVAADEIVLSSEAREEAARNMWTFALGGDEAAGLTVTDVVEFVSAVAAARRRQLRRLGLGRTMRLYVWHDSQASRLRLSLLSSEHPWPPFHCQIRDDATLEEVAAAFLHDPHHDGIPITSDGEESSSGTIVPGDAAGEQPALPVWVVRLSASEECPQ